MKNIFYVLYTIIIAFLSCNDMKDSTYYKSKIEEVLLVPLPDSFRVINYETSSAVGGDYTEEFQLKFKKKDFDKLIGSIDTKKIRIYKNNPNIMDISVYKDSKERIEDIFIRINQDSCAIFYTYRVE